MNSHGTSKFELEEREMKENCKCRERSLGFFWSESYSWAAWKTGAGTL